MTMSTDAGGHDVVQLEGPARHLLRFWSRMSFVHVVVRVSSDTGNVVTE